MYLILVFYIHFTFFTLIVKDRLFNLRSPKKRPSTKTPQHKNMYETNVKECQDFSSSRDTVLCCLFPILAHLLMAQLARANRV